MMRSVKEEEEEEGPLMMRKARPRPSVRPSMLVDRSLSLSFQCKMRGRRTRGRSRRPPEARQSTLTHAPQRRSIEVTWKVPRTWKAADKIASSWLTCVSSLHLGCVSLLCSVEVPQFLSHSSSTTGSQGPISFSSHSLPP